MRIPLIAAIATVALVTPTIPASVEAAPASAPRAGQALTVGTYNINANQRFAVWRKAVRAFRAEVQVAGMQEVKRQRKQSFLRGPAWGSWAPDMPFAAQNPVIWRRANFDLIAARGAKIADARYIGHEAPGTNTHRDTSYATVVRLREKASGQSISVINVHLVAGGVNGGRRIAGHPNLYRLYVEQVRGLAAAVGTERAWAGNRVYVVGDFNVNYPADRKYRHPDLPYARLTKLGLVSAWEARRELKPGRGSGTRGGAYLDGVWHSKVARRVSVMRELKNVSDHYPVVAIYPSLG